MTIQRLEDKRLLIYCHKHQTHERQLYPIFLVADWTNPTLIVNELLKWKPSCMTFLVKLLKMFQMIAWQPRILLGRIPTQPIIYICNDHPGPNGVLSKATSLSMKWSIFSYPQSNPLVALASSISYLFMKRLYDNRRILQGFLLLPSVFPCLRRTLPFSSGWRFESHASLESLYAD